MTCNTQNRPQLAPAMILVSPCVETQVKNNRRPHHENTNIFATYWVRISTFSTHCDVRYTMRGGIGATAAPQNNREGEQAPHGATLARECGRTSNRLKRIFSSRGIRKSSVHKHQPTDHGYGWGGNPVFTTKFRALERADLYLTRKRAHQYIVAAQRSELLLGGSAYCETE